MKNTNASLLKELKPLVPLEVYNEVVERLKQWEDLLNEEERKLQQCRDNVLHLKANCTAEEQTRVSLLEKQGQLEHEKSTLTRDLKIGKEKVVQAKEAKESIRDEIERLSRDLYSEAEKLVAEEVQEKEGLMASQAGVEDEFNRLKSRLILEKDRYQVAVSLAKQAKANFQSPSFFEERSDVEDSSKDVEELIKALERTDDDDDASSRDVEELMKLSNRKNSAFL